MATSESDEQEEAEICLSSIWPGHVNSHAWADGTLRLLSTVYGCPTSYQNRNVTLKTCAGLQRQAESGGSQAQLECWSDYTASGDKCIGCLPLLLWGEEEDVGIMENRCCLLPCQVLVTTNTHQHANRSKRTDDV